MITTLAALPAETTLRADVAVVGAGIAGLLLAARLRELGRSVAVLESGTRQQDADVHPLNEVVLRAAAYGGATRGRARCLGGTSTRWGGAMLPFQPADFGARPHVGVSAWPVSFADLAPGLPWLQGLFGLDDGSFEEAWVAQCGADSDIPVNDVHFAARFAKWPTFANRNVAQLLRRRLESDRDLTVVLDASLTDLDTEPATGRVTALRARNTAGQALRVEAAQIALAAGAIETTRLLLLASRAAPWLVPAGSAVLGRYFHDHLSAGVARFGIAANPRLNRLAGFRFAGSTMRSYRAELTPDAQARHGLPSLWAHVAFGTDTATGIDALRELLRGVQRGQPPTLAALLRLLGHAPFLLRLAAWRGLRRQLLWPPNALAELVLVVEQLPVAGNRVTLADGPDDPPDALGQPRAAIDWRVGDRDRAAFAAGCRQLQAWWERSGLAATAPAMWLPDPTGDADWSPGDVYHPGGTTRMGQDPASAVVDRDLRVHGSPNLYAASTAAFPTGAGANPTLTLMLFAYRLAGHLAARA